MASQLLAPQLFQRLGREGRLAQQAADQREHLGQVFAHGGDA
jgi:hypothetical protein